MTGPLSRKATKPFSGFLRDTDGAATLEFVLWFPMVMIMFFLLVDATMIFHGQSQVLRVLQDGNRNMSIGRFATVKETEDYIENQLGRLSPNAVASSTVTAGVLSTTVTFPAADMQMIGFFKEFNNLTMSVRSDHLIESWDAS